MNKKLIRICALVIGLSGLVILLTTIYPILEYEFQARQKFPILVSPRVEENYYSQNTQKMDFTKASNWFEIQETNQNPHEQVAFFNLTVPKLGIENATVAVAGEDLSRHLIQYPGTALPGKTGNSVIFGHSVLPTYYDPENYMAIFSTLPTLSRGDEIYTTYDGITYKYEVETLFEVRPTDVWILRQDKNGSYLSLVTCTPPGDPRKPKRLIVRAKLVNNAQANVIQTGQ